MDLHELDVRINVAGISATAMHAAAVQLDQTDPRIVAFIRAIERHGVDLKSIQQWSLDARPAADPDAPNPHLVIKAPDLVPLTGAALDAMRRLQHGQAGDTGSAEVVGLLRAQGGLSETAIRDYITQYGPEGQLRRYIDTK